jgi:outer membrane protein OmpA-like peptidoglycan-associated protein
MKKIAAILALILSATTWAATAQIAGGGVGIYNVSVERQGDMVKVDYTAAIAKKAVKWNHTLLVVPVIVGENMRRSLPAFAVHGPGSKAARARREIAYGTMPAYESATLAYRGDTIGMSAMVPFSEWMYGSNMVFESIEAGCCEFGELGQYVVAQGILPPPPPSAPEPLPEPEPVRRSVGDSLATVFKFVAPYSDYDPNFSIDEQDRENGLEVYFPLAKYDIEPDYLDNASNLAKLTGAIRAIAASTDSRVARIVIAGFASPEGSIELNEDLARDRAVALKNYITANTVIVDDQVALYNGAVDWQGLRIRIARGTLPERGALLDLIDNTPVRASAGQPGRLEMLRRMRGGATYRYLQAEHFPYLRTGAFIKVFYDNR